MVSVREPSVSGLNLRLSGRVTTQVCCILCCLSTTLIYYLTEYKEAFALFDKKGTGAVPRETLGDLLRALGQNPTQAEVADIVASAPRDGK
jgi:hypothetical protein